MLRARFALVVVVACVPACGGSSSDAGGGSCGSAACGGELVGTWAAKSVCASGTLSLAIQNCAPATVRIVSRIPSGTVTFDGGGTWQSAITVTASAHLVMANGCMTADQCTQFEASLKAQTGVTSASCSFGSTCACDYGVTDANSNSTGTWQINGTSVTLVTDGSSAPPETDGYCVASSTLTLTSSAGGASSSLVMTRQGP